MNELQFAPSKKMKAAKVEVNADAVAAAVEKAVESATSEDNGEEHQKYLLMEEKRLLEKEKLLCANEERLLLREEKMRKELSASTAAAAEIDSSWPFLEALFNNRTDPPPAFRVLPDTLPFLPVPLPMYPWAYRVVSTLCGNPFRLHTLATPLAGQPTFKVAAVASACESNTMGRASQTSVVFDAVELVFRPMCLALDSLDQKNYITFNKADKVLPDASLLLRGVLMFKVEAYESKNDFHQAESDLHCKMVNWQPAYHGRREYMLCCAIGGKKLRFYAVGRGGYPWKPISREFHTGTLLDRLEIMHTALGCVNILLQQLTHQMPMEPVPLGRTVTDDVTSISYYENYFMKSVNMVFSDNQDEDSLEEVYKRIMALPDGAGLNRPRGILRPRKMPEMQGCCWCVEMPLAKRTIPDTEEALKSLVADVLHGLDALHAAGCVHRDVQASNILQVKEGSYALADFELSGLANEVPPFRALWRWPDECKQEGSIYTTSADIYSLGLLMEAHASLLSPLASEFASMLKRDKPTAEQALRLPWLTC